MYQPSEAIDVPSRMAVGSAGPGATLRLPISIPILILIMIAGSCSYKTSATSSHHCPSSLPSSSCAPPSRACAACKYQRRKCNPDCILAPYFPADKWREFLNAHRLFGVANILKIIRHVDPGQRDDAMRSIIYQSNARARDPIGGCHRIVVELERQLQRDSAELFLVHRQLAIYHAQAVLSPATAALADPNLLLNPLDDGGGGGGGDHVDSGHADNIIINNSNSPNNNQNYRYSGIIGLELPVPPPLPVPPLLPLLPPPPPPPLSLMQHQEQPQCVVDEREVIPLVDMCDIGPDIATGDDDESSKTSTASNTGSFHSPEMSQRETKGDANMIRTALPPCSPSQSSDTSAV